MIKMKKVLTGLFVFSFVILFAASSFAQPQREMMRGENLIKRSPARILHVLKAKQKELNITDNQLEKIKNLAFSFEEKMIQMKSKNSLQHLELKKLLMDRENLDYEEVREALSKASKMVLLWIPDFFAINPEVAFFSSKSLRYTFDSISVSPASLKVSCILW